MFIDKIDHIQEIFLSGGAIIVPLFLMTMVLWFCLSYRYQLLKDVLPKEVRSILQENTLNSEEVKNVFRGLSLKASTYHIIVKTIVMTAPLLGLLGTVGGMIETFDSLAEMSLFSQSGGIAGGISQALVTTQVGLIVAIPGLVGGRILDKRERQFNLRLSQLAETFIKKEESKTKERGMNEVY